ncbi:MAG TPA: hypothetical protein EYP14_12555, partial [Planctomycetaceae bacterium]|nr:hypothetical protein [Planctomycetaceae bacterium]
MRMTGEVWLERFTKLNVYKAKHGEAPHKALLLLALLDMMQAGEPVHERLELTPELAFRFMTLWPIVAYRRTQKPDVRLPFHHLRSDGFWQPYTATGDVSPHKKLTHFVELDDGFRTALDDPEFRRRARRILIARWFQPAERCALYALYNIRVPSDDEIARDANFQAPNDAKQVGREARFRLDVVPAYNYTCALTGYRVTTIDAGSIVDAAHIHAFKDSRNNDPRNGIALCKNAHWLFDHGLWSIDENYRIIVAKGHFSETAPDQQRLAEYHGSALRLPKNKAIWPDKRHLAWHRCNVFRSD